MYVFDRHPIVNIILIFYYLKKKPPEMLITPEW